MGETQGRTRLSGLRNLARTWYLTTTVTRRLYDLFLIGLDSSIYFGELILPVCEYLLGSVSAFQLPYIAARREECTRHSTIGIDAERLVLKMSVCKVAATRSQIKRCNS